MSSTLIFGSNSIFSKIDRFTSLGMDVKLDKALGLNSETPGAKLGELAAQTAKESDPRAIIWGRVRPIGGNLIHCQAPVKRMVKESTQSGGKGGSSKKETKVEHVFRTYAIGVCEGPITAYARIWRNNKLVYDARGTDWGAENNSVFLQAYRLYLGGWEQMPSPDLEAIWGVGNVPAYRGTAYIVALDEDLTEMSGAVPQWQFEVERAEAYQLTSKLYPVVEVAAIDPLATPTTVNNRDMLDTTSNVEALSVGAEVAALTLRDLVKSASNAEALDAGASVESVALRDIVKSPALTTEAISVSVAPTTISIRASVIETRFDTEAITPGASVQSITLTG